ncbi:hypothetical protein ASD77_02525 [Pseudoxanthomonas sp. Root65]|nr:hypothetical protein ASD77_02525 [Pseudoxanthomonas sp. Root65]
MCVAILFLAGQRNESSERFLRIGLSSPDSGSLQAFFDTGSGFNEAESKHVHFKSGSSELAVPLPSGKVQALRLDPAPGVKSVLVRELAITVPRSGGYEAISAGALQPVNEIAGLTRTDGGMQISMAPGSTDAQLMLDADSISEAGTEAPVLTVWTKYVLGILIFALAVFHLARRPSGIPVTALLLAGVVLVAALALVSTTARSIHPDEHNHVAAAHYYFSHWKPPAVDDPAIVDTYTIYGTSYLNELDIGYLIAAKVSNLWSGFGLDDTVSLRLFNVLLLAILLVVAWRGRDTWTGAAVLLVTSQLWYLFSYFNADALPLFLSLMLAFLYGPASSAVSDYVEGKATRFLPLLAFVLVLGLLLISKRNYLLIVMFMGLFLCVRHLALPAWCVGLAAFGAGLLSFSLIGGAQMQYMFPSIGGSFVPVGSAMLLAAMLAGTWRVLGSKELRPKFYRMVALFSLAAMLAFPRVMLDRDVNGGSAEKTAKVLAAAEKYGEVRFKPSTLANNPAASYPGRNLAAKGVTIGQLFGHPYDWLYQSWRSSMGVYGYMNAFAPEWLYLLVSIGLLLCLAGAFRHGIRDGTFRRDTFVVCCIAALVVLSSIVHSWAYDFQPQGRYLMPIAALLAVLALAHPILLRSRLMSAGLATSYLASLFSFLFFAIPILASR